MHDGMTQGRSTPGLAGPTGSALLHALDMAGPAGLLREESRRLLRQQRRLLVEMRDARRAFRDGAVLA